MTERERLVELFKEANEKVGEYIRQNDHMDYIPKPEELWAVKADHLLANGVIVPPCKVGDTVYRISKRYGEWCVLPRMVSSMTYSLDHLYRVVWCIHTTADDYLGKTVFLTREEAEAALEERTRNEHFCKSFF